MSIFTGISTRTDRRSIMLGAATMIGLAGCDGQARPLFSADTQPDGYPTVAAVTAMGEMLADRTKGELRIRNYAGGQLGSETETLEITIFGGLDLNRVYLGALNSIAPITSIMSLPYLFSSVAHARHTFDGAPGRALLQALEPSGLIGLCFYDSGTRNFYNRRGPVTTPDDMRGLKLRVPTSDLYVAMVAAAGANPTPMPLGEVYQALVQGVVDGAENNLPSFQNTRHFEVAPYYSRTEHVMAPEVLVMSRRTWARLRPDHRDAIMESARDSVGVMRKLWDEREATSQAQMLEKGVQFNEVDRAAFAARMEPIWDRFMTTPEMRRLVEDIRNLGANHA